MGESGKYIWIYRRKSFPLLKMIIMKVLVFDFKGFGKALKQHRVIERDVKISDVSKATMVGIATISRIENGGSSDIDPVLNLCNWMNVSVNSFVKLEKK